MADSSLEARNGVVFIMVMYRPSGKRGSLPARLSYAADERLPVTTGVRRQLNKVFPDHWSFMLGEIALYSFIILLLTGTYLTFFFDPSMSESRYGGTYTPLRGTAMSQAYSSTLHISFDVRGGLVIRQMHHWAALLFVAAIVVHMLRIFFTGAFRKPREANWLIGILLMWLGILEGFIGYSLPDDGVSGTGLRIADSILLSIPVVGTWLEYLIFGGTYPGDIILPRFYIVHVLLIPGLILALVSVHLTFVVLQKHTQFPGARRTESTVAGERVLPHYAAKGGGFFMIVFGVIALLGGLVQINPVWLWGPYSPAVVTSGSQPDWYMGFLEGSIRLWPAWETHFRNYTIPAVFWPAVVLPGILTMILLAYPFLEARLTADRVRHNLLQRPRDAPVRTALGAMAVSFYVVLWLSGGDDIIADEFNISLNAVVWLGRVLLVLIPPAAYASTYLACLGLEHHDRELLRAGVETGIIRMSAGGRYSELHQPLGPVDRHGDGTLPYAGAPVPKKINSLLLPRRLIGFFYPLPVPPDAAADDAANKEHEDVS